jgi:hypothetical protein
VYEQHRRFFGEEDRDPREALLDDLKDAIKEWQAAGDIIVLGMDANEDTRSRELRTYFDELGMKNAILERHKHLSPPATHNRNQCREPIDGIWISKCLDVIAAGFLAVGDGCPSDHVALWIDLRKQDVLGSKAETIAPKIHKLTTDDPRLVDKYNRLAKKELQKVFTKERLTTLSLIKPELWTDENVTEYNALHQNSTKT